MASDNEQRVGIVRVSTRLYLEWGQLLQPRGATQAIATLHPRGLQRSAGSRHCTRCAMSVAYEAQSRDYSPDNRPNLRMSAKEVFSLKNGILAEGRLSATKKVLGSHGPIRS